MNSPVEQIKSRLDIVEVVSPYVKLQKAGVNFKAACPFHNEKTPSFFVSPTRQSWHCFGACNKGGDIFSFLQEIEGLDFPEALHILALRAGVELRREPKEVRDARARLFEANELAAQFFETQLAKSEAGNRARAYLAERGLKNETIAQFKLGWAPNQRSALTDFLRLREFSLEEIERVGLAFVQNQETRNPIPGGPKDRFRGRIMFPIFDGNSRVVGFTGRIFGRDEGEYDPKYLNSPETPIFEKSRILYGLHAARKAIRKEEKAVFVEGQMDCLLAHQAGTTNVVATSGTALTSHHLALISRLTNAVVFAYDSDRAGTEAAKRGIELALEAGLTTRLALVPSGKDPAEFIQKDPEGWSALLASGTKPVTDFLFENAAAVSDVTTAEGKRGVVAALLPTLVRIANAIERSEWVADIARRLQIREEALWEELAKQKPAHAGQKSVISDVSARKETGRSRRELLEEHFFVLCLVGGRPPEIQESDSLLTSSRIQQFFHVMRSLDEKALDGAERFRAFHETVPQGHRAYANALALAAEALMATARNIEDEIALCVRELRALALRDRLDAISLELESAENAGDSGRIRELSEEFKLHSARLSQLFIQPPNPITSPAHVG